MVIKIGTDVVYIPRFTKAIESEGEIFFNKIFLEQELKNGVDPTHLAGIFAAKEAVIKALSFSSEDWLTILIRHTRKGRPYVELLHDEVKIPKTSDLSIAHDHEYAEATYIAIF